MRLLSYLFEGEPRYGAAVAGGVVDLTRRIGRDFSDVKALIAANALADAQEAVSGQKPDHALEDLVLLPPVLAPEKLWCIGVNYAERNAEYKDSSDLPKYPSLFVRSMSSMTGSGQPIEKPKVSDQLDYEGELVIVIGHGGRHIPRDKAFAHIFGMTLCNEGTVRDWLRHGKFNVTQGKNFDRFRQHRSVDRHRGRARSARPSRHYHARQRRGAAAGHDRAADVPVRLPDFLSLHLRHLEARRHDRDGHADRSGRPLRSAALAQRRRCRRGRVQPYRRAAQHRGRGELSHARRRYDRTSRRAPR
ncbi:hypothetical protein ACVWXO_003266 [Bradyrhizobium sp. LM2.7]